MSTLKDHSCNCPYCPQNKPVGPPRRWPHPDNSGTWPAFKPCDFCSKPFLMVIPHGGMPCPGGCGAWLSGPEVTCIIDYSTIER